MSRTLIDGIVARKVVTDRLCVNVLERAVDVDRSDHVGTIVFTHGNVSSSSFWMPTMLRMPQEYRCIAVDLRGFGDTETLDVDATRGVADFSDDVASVLTEMGIDSAHFVGWSMGGGVVQQLMLDYPDLVITATLQAPVSPYGFGGTAGADGRMLTTDAAGAGAGGANPDFVTRLAAGDATADEQTSPRSVYRSAYVAPGFESALEDVWVESMLSQTRAVLEAYATAGGEFREVVLENCGHSPHLERPDAFDEALLAFVG